MYVKMGWDRQISRIISREEKGGVTACVQQGQSQPSNEMQKGETRDCQTRGGEKKMAISVRTCKERWSPLLYKLYIQLRRGQMNFFSLRLQWHFLETCPKRKKKNLTISFPLSLILSSLLPYINGLLLTTSFRTWTWMCSFCSPEGCPNHCLKGKGDSSRYLHLQTRIQLF